MRRRLLVLVLAVALVAVGCSPEESPQEVLAAAPNQTIAERTSRLDLDVNVTGGRAAGTFRGGGVFDYRAQRGQIELDLSTVGIPAPGGRAELLLLGDLIFVKLPLDLPELAGRPWVKVDVKQLGRQAGVDLSSLRQLQNNDPTPSMQFLEGVDTAEEVGKETLRGTETTHYKATLDLARVRQRVAPEVKDDVDRIRDQLGVEKVPTDAWVDGEGRLRRLRQRIDLANAKTTGLDGQPLSGVVTNTFELYDFGVRVDVQEPPADQVSDLGTLFGGATPGPGAAVPAPG